MKVRALQPFTGPDGPVAPGDVVEVEDTIGARLLRHGFAKEFAAATESRKQGMTRGRRAVTPGSGSGAGVPASRADAAPERDEDESASGKT